MDSEIFKARVKRLKEVNSVVAKLDPAIRGEAFSLLSGYITAHSTRGGAGSSVADEIHNRAVHEQSDTDDAEKFFANHPDGNKPSDNVVMIAAYWYSQYGKAPFGLDDIRELADSAGVTIPEHPDMTLKAGKAGPKGALPAFGNKPV